MNIPDKKSRLTTHVANFPFRGDRVKLLISIVMPAYNAEKYIFEVIDSILCQSFTNIECFIVDYGSIITQRKLVVHIMTSALC